MSISARQSYLSVRASGNDRESMNRENRSITAIRALGLFFRPITKAVESAISIPTRDTSDCRKPQPEPRRHDNTNTGRSRTHTEGVPWCRGGPGYSLDRWLMRFLGRGGWLLWAYLVLGKEFSAGCIGWAVSHGGLVRWTTRRRCPGVCRSVLGTPEPDI